MVCEVAEIVITPEFDEFLLTRPKDTAAMQELGAMLPADDDELHARLLAAGEEMYESHFTYGFCAAVAAGRRLRASLLPCAISIRSWPWHIAYAAWRMEGDVTTEMLRGLDSGPISPECGALCLFVATAWWQKHRPGEPLPRRIPRLTEALEKAGVPPQSYATLRALKLLLGKTSVDPSVRAAAHLAVIARKQQCEVDRHLQTLDGPMEFLFPDRPRRDFISSAPCRRAVEKIGANEKCPCGSEKKYKKCCQGKDRGRQADCSAFPGVTREELNSIMPACLLTERILKELRPAELLNINVLHLPGQLQPNFLARLAEHGHFDWLLASLHVLSHQTGGLPEHLYKTWADAFAHVAGLWRPDIARQLLELFPDADEKLGEKPNAGIKVLLVGDDPAKVLETIEAELHNIFASGDVDQLFYLAGYLLASPYRSLGVSLAHSFFPIAKDNEQVTHLFEKVLDSRAKLNLPPDDEFSDFMNERALKKARRNESDATADLEAKLERTAEEKRAADEKVAELNRQLALKTQQQRREEGKTQVDPDLKSQEAIRQLKADKKATEGFAAEKSKEARLVRRELEKATREIEELKAAQEAPNRSQRKEEETGELVSFEGNQPARLPEFSKDFNESFTELPPKARQAILKRIGLITAGDKAGFDKIKQLKAYPGVLRARVADKLRLFFVLTPDRVRIVDVIWRDDLDKWIKQLLARGLPNN